MVDKYGQTMDFLRTEHRDTEAALRFLTKAIRRNGLAEIITIDNSDANEAAIKRYHEAHGTAIVIRQVQYLHNVVEQDHRGVKRVTRPMLGFQSFEAAQDTLVGIELMPMLKKRQRRVEAGDEGRTAAALFYSLAASSLHRQGQRLLHDLLRKICAITACCARVSIQDEDSQDGGKVQSGIDIPPYWRVGEDARTPRCPSPGGSRRLISSHRHLADFQCWSRDPAAHVQVVADHGNVR